MERIPEKGQNLVDLENWVDEAVMSFIVDMKYKLRLNNHKGHWKEYHFKYLLERIDDELAELRSAVMAVADTVNPDKRLLLAIIHECADIANFAMMLADNAKFLMRSFKDESYTENRARYGAKVSASWKEDGIPEDRS